MNKSLLLAGLMLLSGCSSQPTLLEKVSPVIVKNQGTPLFAVPVPNGHWYLSASSKTTMTYGFVHVEGAFPDPTKIPHSIRIQMDLVDESWENLAQILPSIKSNNYEKYLAAGQEWYTPARVKERGIKRLGSRVVQFKEFYCRNSWYETTVAPHINEGKGVALYTNSVDCPLVVDGHVYRFSMGITTYIGAWYYNNKEAYEKTRKPGDPEFPPSFEAAMNRDGAEDYLPSIGRIVAQLFSGIQFYGKVSQNYADIENPESLQEKIDHPEPYQPKMRSGK